jgi:hypothetical protein
VLGVKATFAAAVVRRAATGAVEMHHLLPQAKRFRTFFERAGRKTKTSRFRLIRRRHRLKPGGIHTKGGGDWNRVWDDFFEANPNATKEQILQQVERMRRDFGI